MSAAKRARTAKLPLLEKLTLEPARGSSNALRIRLKARSVPIFRFEFNSDHSFTVDRIIRPPCLLRRSDLP